MDLRTGETIWRLKNGCPPIYPPLAADTTCDVVIIGGGISGALIAHELLLAGLDCIIIDKRESGAGSTSASTALLLYEFDTPLFELADRIGEKEAAACYHASLEALSRLGHLAATLPDDCDFLPRKSYYIADTEADVADLRREQAIRQKHGIHVDLLEKSDLEKIFPFSKPAALCTTEAAEVDVVRLVDTLTRESIALGLRIHGATGLSTYDVGKHDIMVRTTSGHGITARHLVFATGYESEKYLGKKVGSLKSTYALATAPIDDFTGWHERALLWTTADPYLYLRTTRDNRVIIGGGDIDYQDDKIRDALLPEKTAFLEKSLREFFPAMKFETACAWTGTFGETPDSMARIGHTKKEPRVHFALGYGGNGITYSMLAACIIRDACLNRKNPAAKLFRLDR